MYKLVAVLSLSVVWLTFFIMGVARVERTEGFDGSTSSVGSVADFFVPHNGTNCVCDTADTCLCDFPFTLGTIRTRGDNCTTCSVGTACRTCILQVVPGNNCACTTAAVSTGGGDGGDAGGADGGDGGHTYGRFARGLDGGDADAGDAGDAGDAVAAPTAKAATCAAGTEAKTMCQCTFGLALTTTAHHSASAVDRKATAADAADAADGDDAAAGDSTPVTSTDASPKAGQGLECCCNGSSTLAVATGGDGADGADGADAAGRTARGQDAAADGDDTGDDTGAGAGAATLAAGSCTCKLPKVSSDEHSYGDDADAGDANADADADADADANADANADGDATERAATGLDAGDAGADAGTTADAGDADATTGGDGDAGGDGTTTGTTAGTFRPKAGVIDGQGCTGRAGCSRSTAQPYYIWTEFISGNKHQSGGMVYFEHRGDHGGPIAGLLIAWMAVLLVITMVAVAFRKTYQPTLSAPAQKGSVAYYLDNAFFVPLRLTWGELVMSLWIVGWLVLCFLYVWNHAYINNLVGPVARGFGGVVCGLLILMLFPVSKKSVLVGAFGISFERALKFHRRMGFYVLFFTIVHFILILSAHFAYYRQGEPIWDGSRTYKPGSSIHEAGNKAWERMMRWEIGYPHGPPMAGFFCLIILLVIVGATFVRERHWNLFAAVHTLYAVLYPMAWIHYPTLMVFCAIPLFLYLVDMCLRYFQAYTDGAKIQEVTAFDCGITRVQLKKRSLDYSPGQWISLRIPSADKIVAEWHPFSVSSIRHQDDGVELTVHCKNMGAGTWTSRVPSAAVGETAMVQGCFGNLKFDIASASEVLMIAGGVGVTPMLGALYAALSTSTNPDTNNKAVHYTLVWCYRGDVPAAFSKELSELQSSGLNVTWHMHNTADANNSDPEKGAVSNVHYHAGRPDYSKLMENGTPSVIVCGPAPLALEAETAALARSLPVHAEVFDF